MVSCKFPIKWISFTDKMQGLQSSARIIHIELCRVVLNFVGLVYIESIVNCHYGNIAALAFSKAGAFD